MIKKVGKWGATYYEIVEIENRYIVINENGWNGTYYDDCWEVEKNDLHRIIDEKKKIVVLPTFEELGDEYEIIDYEIIEERDE